MLCRRDFREGKNHYCSATRFIEDDERSNGIRELTLWRPDAVKSLWVPARSPIEDFRFNIEETSFQELDLWTGLGMF